MGATVCYPEEANEAMVTVEKEAKKAVDMVQTLANGGETVEASENLWPCVNTLLKIVAFYSSCPISLV